MAELETERVNLESGTPKPPREAPHFEIPLAIPGIPKPDGEAESETNFEENLEAASKKANPEGDTQKAMDVPQDILDRIRLREGWETVVYRDTRGFLTAGMGHLLIPTQLAQYPLGATIPNDVLAGWENADTIHAYSNGLAMANRIGVNDPNLIEALTCAAFQLGDHIPTEFPTLWGLLMAHNWNAAAADAGTTLWSRQTPARVKDFQAFLRAIPTDQTPGVPTEVIA